MSAPTILNPPGLQPPSPVYALATKVGGWIHTAGIVSLDASGAVVGAGDIAAQTRRVLEIIRTILEAGGASLRDVAMVQIFLSDFTNYAAMNAVYREFFPAEPPARYCVRADLVRSEWLVEIAVVAHTGAG